MLLTTSGSPATTTAHVPSRALRGSLALFAAIAASWLSAPAARAQTFINVPDGSFEQANVGEGYTQATSAAYPNLSIQVIPGDATGVGPVNDGSPNFSIKNTAGSQSISGPAAQNGSNFMSMWPSDRATDTGTTVPLTTAFQVLTTGISDTVVAGRTYTATVAVDLPGYAANTSVAPTYTISVMDGSHQVGTQSISGTTAVNSWQDLSTLPWTAPAGSAGDALEVLVTIGPFVEGPTHSQVDQGAIDNIRLSYGAVPEPGSVVLMVFGTIGLGALACRRRRTT